MNQDNRDKGSDISGRITIDISQTSPIVCDKCGHNTFTQVYIMRMVSAVYSPNGEESLMPIPVFECSACGHVNDIFLPEGLKLNQDIEAELDNIN